MNNTDEAINDRPLFKIKITCCLFRIDVLQCTRTLLKEGNTKGGFKKTQQRPKRSFSPMLL